MFIGILPVFTIQTAGLLIKTLNDEIGVIHLSFFNYPFGLSSRKAAYRSPPQPVKRFDTPRWGYSVRTVPGTFWEQLTALIQTGDLFSVVGWVKPIASRTDTMGCTHPSTLIMSTFIQCHKVQLTLATASLALCP